MRISQGLFLHLLALQASHHVVVRFVVEGERRHGALSMRSNCSTTARPNAHILGAHARTSILGEAQQQRPRNTPSIPGSGNCALGIVPGDRATKICAHAECGLLGRSVGMTQTANKSMSLGVRLRTKSAIGDL